MFNFLVKEKRVNFLSGDEVKRFVLYYMPWCIWTNALQDLGPLFQVLNKQAVVINELKKKYGKLLGDEVLHFAEY